MDNEPKFKLYSYVHKKKGYKYPGMVMAVFQTRKGEWRYAVEAIHPDFEGMLHIFSSDQLVNTNEELLRVIVTEYHMGDGSEGE